MRDTCDTQGQKNVSRSFTGVRWRVINLDTQDRTGGQDMEGHVGKERKGEEKERKGKERK